MRVGTMIPMGWRRPIVILVLAFAQVLVSAQEIQVEGPTEIQAPERVWFPQGGEWLLRGLARDQPADLAPPEDAGERGPWVRQRAWEALAFMDAGYDHRTPNKWRKVVLSALRALMACRDEHGRYAGEVAATASATWALTRAWTLTNDPDLEPVIADGVEALLAERQGPEGACRGWPALHGGEVVEGRSSVLAAVALDCALRHGAAVGGHIWFEGQGRGAVLQDLSPLDRGVLVAVLARYLETPQETVAAAVDAAGRDLLARLEAGTATGEDLLLFQRALELGDAERLLRWGAVCQRWTMTGFLRGLVDGHDGRCGLGDGRRPLDDPAAALAAVHRRASAWHRLWPVPDAADLRERAGWRPPQAPDLQRVERGVAACAAIDRPCRDVLLLACADAAERLADPALRERIRALGEPGVIALDLHRLCGPVAARHWLLNDRAGGWLHGLARERPRELSTAIRVLQDHGRDGDVVDWLFESLAEDRLSSLLRQGEAPDAVVRSMVDLLIEQSPALADLEIGWPYAELEVLGRASPDPMIRAGALLLLADHASLTDESLEAALEELLVDRAADREVASRACLAALHAGLTIPKGLLDQARHALGRLPRDRVTALFPAILRSLDAIDEATAPFVHDCLQRIDGLDSAGVERLLALGAGEASIAVAVTVRCSSPPDAGLAALWELLPDELLVPAVPVLAGHLDSQEERTVWRTLDLLQRLGAGAAPALPALGRLEDRLQAGGLAGAAVEVRLLADVATDAERILDLLSSPDSHLRLAALRVACHRGHPAIAQRVRNMANDPQTPAAERGWAAVWLALHADPEPDLLARIATDPRHHAAAPAGLAQVLWSDDVVPANLDPWLPQRGWHREQVRTLVRFALDPIPQDALAPTTGAHGLQAILLAQMSLARVRGADLIPRVVRWAGQSRDASQLERHLVALHAAHGIWPPPIERDPAVLAHGRPGPRPPLLRLPGEPPDQRHLFMSQDHLRPADRDDPVRFAELGLTIDHWMREPSTPVRALQAIRAFGPPPPRGEGAAVFDVLASGDWLAVFDDVPSADGLRAAALDAYARSWLELMPIALDRAHPERIGPMPAARMAAVTLRLLARALAEHRQAALAWEGDALEPILHRRHGELTGLLRAALDEVVARYEADPDRGWDLAVAIARDDLARVVDAAGLAAIERRLVR